MIHLDLVQSPFSWALLLLGVLVFAAQRVLGKPSTKPAPRPFTPRAKHHPEYSEDAYHDIEPLHSLHLASEQPIQLRTFKPKYHLTMALENTTMSELVAMDNTYEARIKLRSDLIRENTHEVLAHRPAAGPAVSEFYAWMMEYLPSRFPTVYTRTPTGILNTVTSLTLPRNTTDTEQALTLLGSNVDTDFLFLLPAPATDASDGPKYSLEGFITCFPSGFSTRSKLGLSLADIHTPVPGYASKLQKPMDRFFASLPVGRIVKRHNWTITTKPDLFVTSGTHIHAGDQVTEGAQDEVDLARTVLRCERQTLHRLPGTKALVFAFKTYTYPIGQVRGEGSGEALAEAIEGLGRGNVPEMTVYKRQVLWAPRVTAFLRGEIDE
ncbi:hypothetical protein P171DRAFT_284735 [Karstenula rhodostoma CBS 690.94]|uniref:HRQ family protein 2 n=1 Tax=Karstenula rhodostoma CBS 690.94 TaxID=1392251 RepID=A0A9P4PJ01_9PLEO|nr:hypothetical protein P171DRAFT_284735 [Karstenula rhodostoma CBS 690.94]